MALSWLFGAFVILLPAWLLVQIVRDLVLGVPRFFSFSEKLPNTKKLAYTCGSFLFLVSLWFLLSNSGRISPQFLPTPENTCGALSELILTGEIWPNLWASLQRVLLALIVAGLLGVCLGSVAGTFSRCAAIFLPVNSVLRYPPPTSFIGLTIVWFGIDESAKIAFIFIALFFYVVQMTADAVRSVPKMYIEVAQTLGASRWEIFTRVILSMSLPEILAVLRVNLSAAWNFLIVSELVAAQSGLGYLMAISQRFLQTPRLFALLFVVGLVGFLSDALFALIIRYSARWKTSHS
jgi:NitT/TauT family transport system permease protein